MREIRRGGVEVQERMVSHISMGETPGRVEDPTVRKTVRTEGEEASHESFLEFSRTKTLKYAKTTRAEDSNR